MQKQDFVNKRGLMLFFSFIFLLAIFCPVNVSAFDINAIPSASITFPAGGETFNAGDTVTIKWNQSNVSGVRLSYKHGNSIFITSNTEDINSPTGSYSWKTPSDLVTGSYTIYLEAYGAGSSGTESNNFNITGLAHFVYPSSNCPLTNLKIDDVSLNYDNEKQDKVDINYSGDQVFSDICNYFPSPYKIKVYDKISGLTKYFDVTQPYRQRISFVLDPGTYDLVVTIDSDNVIAESNETDNTFEKKLTILDDSLPNVISGITIPAETIRSNSAIISWKTSKNTDSIVKYAEKGSTNWAQAGEPGFAVDHSTTIPNLKQATTYQYYIDSTYNFTQETKSDIGEFTTANVSGTNSMAITDITTSSAGVSEIVKNTGVYDIYDYTYGILIYENSTSGNLVSKQDKHFNIPIGSSIAGSPLKLNETKTWDFAFQFNPAKKYVIQAYIGGTDLSPSTKTITVNPRTNQSISEAAKPSFNTTPEAVNPLSSTSQNSQGDKVVIITPKQNTLSNNIDLNLSKRLSGKILLQVQSGGAAWYVDPKTYKKYSLNLSNIKNVIISRGVGITNTDINKIPVAVDSLGAMNVAQDSDKDGYSDKTELQNGYNPNGAGKLKLNTAFAVKQRGKILLQVQSKGEAWYVNPSNNRRYFLGNPANALNVLKNLGLGITDSNINKIGVGDKLSAPVTSGSPVNKPVTPVAPVSESTTCAIPDKCIKYRGVEITWSKDNNNSAHLNPAGVADQPTRDVSGTNLSEDRVDASLAIVKKALDKYPLEVLKKFIYKIYILNNVYEKGVNVGGMADPWNVKIFVAYNSDSDRFEQGIHHEIAHNIIKSLHYTVNFYQEDLDRLNTGGLSYDNSIRSEVVANDSDYTSVELWKAGFLTYYCRANEDEDFSTIAQNMFKIDKTNALKDFWNTVSQYPILKSKVDYVINFYKNNIDPSFTEEYFHRISAE
ncbi:MAG: putative zinc-binding metallopeptidase [Patescibacteria group bacterium]|nr:putative zinc-binding metallopeptidase [Patescibacteria group bacterium]